MEIIVKRVPEHADCPAGGADVNFCLFFLQKCLALSSFGSGSFAAWRCFTLPPPPAAPGRSHSLVVRWSSVDMLTFSKSWARLAKRILRDSDLISVRIDL